MKNILPLLFFFVSTLSFAQNTSISGEIKDFESNNEPLAYAKVLIKETGAEVLTDENGVFQFKNLKENTYTLVCSFIGYETKKIKATVTSLKSAEVKLFLNATTVSLDELMILTASTSENTTANK